MVRVPEYQRNVSLRPSNRADYNVRASADAFGASAGRGLTQLAQGVSNLAGSLDAVRGLEDETVARNARNNYLRDKDTLLYDPQKGYMQRQGKDAIDAHDGYGKSLVELRRKHSADLTPAQQKLFDSSVDPLEIDARRSGLLHKGTALKSFVVEAASNGADNLKREALRNYDDPAAWEKYIAAGEAEIIHMGERLGWSSEKLRAQREAYASDARKLTALEIANDDPIAAIQYIEEHRDALLPADYLNTLRELVRPAGAAATADAVGVRNANSGAAAASSVSTLVDRIVRVESGGDAQAKNPNSSATGAGQFISGTWVKMIRDHRPDIAAGKSNAEILDLRTDAALAREMTARYAEENTRILSAAGIPTTAGNLYLGHFLGPGGARAVLSSSDGTKLDELLSPAVIKANSFLRGRDVGWIKAWAANKMGDAEAASVTFSPQVAGVIDGLPPNVARQIRLMAASGISSFDTQQAAEIKAHRLAVVDEYKLQIASDDMSLTSQQIMDDPVLDNGDKAALINSFNSKRGELMQTELGIQAYRSGQLIVDPYSTEGKKSVDNVWARLSETLDPAQKKPALDDLVRQTGVIPKPVANAIRGDLASGDPAAVAGAMKLASRLHSIDRAAFTRRDGGSQVQDAIASFRHLTDTMGMSPEAAAQRMVDMRDPANLRERDALIKSKPIRDFIDKEATEDRVRNIFDPGVFGFDPALGETSLQAAGMVAEYREMLEDSLYEVGGDTDLAKALAADRFKRLNSTSDFAMSGRKVVVRLPPEVTYPAGPDGSHDYIRQQAIDALNGAGVSVDEIFLQSDAITEADFNAGKPARYQVWYAKDGVLEVFHLPFFAVPPTTATNSEAGALRDYVRDRDFAVARQKAEALRDENMAQQERYESDRGATLEKFLTGNPLTGELEGK